MVAEGAQHPPQVKYIEHAGDGSLGRVLDHVGIAVSDLASSERFYRTVLSVLGVEPSRWGRRAGRVGRLGHRANGPRAPGDPRAPRRLPRPRPRAGRRVLAGGRRRSVPRRRCAGAAHAVRPDVLRRVPARPRRRRRRPRRSTATATTPCPTAASTTCGSASATRRPPGASTRRSPRTPGSAWRTTKPAACSCPARTTASRSSGTSGRSRSTCTSRSPRAEGRPRCAPSTPPRSRRASRGHGTTGERAVYHPGYYGAFVLDPDGHDVEVVNHNRG